MATTASINDQTALVGNFKDVWGSDILSLFKFQAPLMNRVPFEQGNLVGGYFHQPLDLQQEHGFTCAAASSTPTLNQPLAGFAGDMKIQGAQLYGRSRVSYEAIMRSATDKQAVKQATKHIVKRLGLSGSKRLELQFLHGQRGLGTVSSVAAEAGGAAPYTTVVTLTDATWSAGIWAGMEGAQLDVYSAVGGTFRNSNCSTSTADTTDTARGPTITAVNVTNKTITISYGLARASWTGGAIQAGDVLYFDTASSTTEMAGLDVICRNAGSMMNIDAATYALWGGNVASSFGTPSMAKLLEALSIAASFGLTGMTAVAVVPPKMFEVLNSDQAALRNYDVSYRPSKGEAGVEGLVYHSQTGNLEILPHAFQKDGQAHIFVPDETHRIGAADFGFVVRGGNPPQLVIEAADSPASEMRTQSHQAIYVEAPRHCVAIDGITY